MYMKVTISDKIDDVIYEESHVSSSLWSNVLKVTSQVSRITPKGCCEYLQHKKNLLKMREYNVFIYQNIIIHKQYLDNYLRTFVQVSNHSIYAFFCPAPWIFTFAPPRPAGKFAARHIPGRYFLAWANLLVFKIWSFTDTSNSFFANRYHISPWIF